MRLKTSRVITLCFVSLFGGLYMARFGAEPSNTLIFVSLVLAAIFLITKKSALATVIAFIFCYNIGLWHGHSYFGDQALFKSLIGSKVTVEGVIKDDPAYGERGQLEFHLKDLVLKRPYLTELHGDLRVRTFIGTSIRTGVKVEATGKVSRALGSRHGSINFAQIKVINRDVNGITEWRGRFIAATYSALPDETASLGLGFLIGVRSLLPEKLTDDLQITGLTHIVAVSGYNLTILVGASRRLFENHSKRLAMLLCIGLILSFLAATAGSASIVRASIVSGLGLTAWYYGRTMQPLTLLIVSAAVSAYINPYFIWLDLGWYLSFLAFFGVLVLSPLIGRRIFKGREPKLLSQILLETACAQLMTAPLIAYIFGSFSLIALAANLIVLPFIPLAMLLTFLAGTAQMLSTVLGGLIALPAVLILEFIIGAVHLLAAIPWAFKEVEVNKLEFVLYYAAIAALALLIFSKARPKPTSPPL